MRLSKDSPKMGTGLEGKSCTSGLTRKILLSA